MEKGVTAVGSTIFRLDKMFIGKIDYCGAQVFMRYVT